MARIFLVAIHDFYSLGTRYLYSSLKHAGHQVKVCYLRKQHRVPGWNLEQDAHHLVSKGALSVATGMFPVLTEEEDHALHETLAAFSPDLVGVSCRFTSEYIIPVFLDAVATAAPQALRICGGWGPTMNAAFYLDNGADLIMRGEGELALVQLADCLDKKLPWQDVPNILYRDGGIMRQNPMLPLVGDLDSLPLDDILEEDLLYIDGKDGLNRMARPMFHYCMGSRGCVGSCTYCCTSRWRNMYKDEHGISPLVRKRSVPHLLDELIRAKSSGRKGIMLLDDYFVRPTHELKQFFDRYNEEVALPLAIQMYHEQLLKDENLFDSVSQYMVWTAVGLQTGSESFNKEIYNRERKLDICRDILARYLDAFIQCECQFIGGQTLETEETFEETLDFIRSLTRLRQKAPNCLLLVNAYFIPVPESPIVSLHNLPLENPYAKKKWLYEALLLEARLLCSDAIFQRIRESVAYREEPFLLQRDIPTLRYAWEEQRIENIAHDMAGREILFWGNGQAYEACKHFFATSKPVGMLLDEPYASCVPNRVYDGIPVLSPAEAIAAQYNYPIILFAEQERALTMARRMYRDCRGLAENLFIVSPPCGSQRHIPLIPEILRKKVYTHCADVLSTDYDYEYFLQIIFNLLIKPGDTVVDVGANKGYHTLALAALCGEHGMVRAFEAVPDLADNLRHLCAGLPVTVEAVALTNPAVAARASVLPFHYVAKASGFSGIRRRPDVPEALTVDSITVPASTLDACISPAITDIALIKIDAEGGDFHVLQGAERILRDSRPVVVFEFFRDVDPALYEYSREEFFSFFESLDYRLFTLNGEEFTRDLWEAPYMFWEIWAVHRASPHLRFFMDNLAHLVDNHIDRQQKMREFHVRRHEKIMQKTGKLIR